MEPAVIDALYNARRKGRPLGLRGDFCGVDEALAAQLQVAERFAAAGDPIGGWKVGFTSGSARDTLGDGFRPFGFIQKSRMFHSGDSVRFESAVARQLEPELCLVMGTRLGGADVNPTQAKAAVRGVAAAFELNEIRHPSASHAERVTLLADGLAQWGLVVGVEVPPPASFDSVRMELFRDGMKIETAVANDTVRVDDPYLSLSRLCATLHRFGQALEPGQPIITGSFTHVAVNARETWRARFGGIGEVSVQIIEGDG